MRRLIRAVIFDLGGTLMHPRGPWEPVQERADQALVDSLSRSGFRIPPGFAGGFRWRLARYYREREKNLFETTYFSVLREMLVEQSPGPFKDSDVRAALDALYAVTQSNWEMEPDAALTLRMLESGGYRLGLVSNAGDDKDVKTLARRFQFDGFFDFILTSAACSYRKPHPRIFELALAHWGFASGEAAMVGDALDADIFGAQQAGLYSIWYPANLLPSGAVFHIHPDATVARLLDIPDLLNKLT
jgi:HAD superfamily hydrolase (TIGR01662 family)